MLPDGRTASAGTEAAVESHAQQPTKDKFQDLSPGKYRLVAKAEDGAPALELWNQNVTVEAGQVTQLPLSATNSKVKPASSRGPRRSSEIALPVGRG